jgi:hypothetical protein
MASARSTLAREEPCGQQAFYPWLVTARSPLGSSAWTWVYSASTAGAVCSCEWCVCNLTYCCPLPAHGERQPEPRGIPFMPVPHCNRHHLVVCRPEAAPVPGLEEESVLVLQVSTTSVHPWFMLGISAARVRVEVRVRRRLWVISSGRLPDHDAAPHGCHLHCACCVSGGRNGLCVHGQRVIALEAPVMPTIPLRGDLSVAVPGCSCLPRPRTSDNGTQRKLSTSPF